MEMEPKRQSTVVNRFGIAASRCSSLKTLINIMEEEKSISDAKLESILDDLRLDDPRLACDQGLPISKMCANPNCKVALLCGDEDCMSCGTTVHPFCLSVSLKGITNMLNKQVGKYKEFVSRVVEIDNSLIEAIHQSRKELTKHEYLMGNIDRKSQKVIEDIYRKRDPKALSGSEARDFYQKMQTMVLNAVEKTKDLQKYERETARIIDEVMQLKRGLFNSFMSDSIIDSAVLSSEAKQKNGQLAFLRQSLGNPKQFRLLYRGSENGFSASAFHQKCDKIPNTLVLVRTEFKKTIGGYSKYPWASDNGTWVNDPEKAAFLLSLDLEEKMVPNDGTGLIQKYCAYGPIFGMGGDIVIADKCHLNNSSRANFPSKYNAEGPHKYENGQYAVFSGATVNSNFKVEEYEVFQVIY